VSGEQRPSEAQNETCEHGYYTLEALLTASKIAREQERERIVAWLRGWANEKHPIEAGEVLFSPAGRGLILMGATAIERGEHR
jgi:hypothetical protein